jgi:hypothetical protein
MAIEQARLVLDVLSRSPDARASRTQWPCNVQIRCEQSSAATATQSPNSPRINFVAELMVSYSTSHYPLPRPRPVRRRKGDKLPDVDAGLDNVQYLQCSVGRGC